MFVIQVISNKAALRGLSMSVDAPLPPMGVEPIPDIFEGRRKFKDSIASRPLSAQRFGCKRPRADTNEITAPIFEVIVSR